MVLKIPKVTISLKSIAEKFEYAGANPVFHINRSTCRQEILLGDKCPRCIKFHDHICSLWTHFDAYRWFPNNIWNGFFTNIRLTWNSNVPKCLNVGKFIPKCFYICLSTCIQFDYNSICKMQLTIILTLDSTKVQQIQLMLKLVL